VSQLYKSPEVKAKLRAVTERMRNEVPGEKSDHSLLRILPTGGTVRRGFALAKLTINN